MTLFRIGILYFVATYINLANFLKFIMLTRVSFKSILNLIVDGHLQLYLGEMDTQLSIQRTDQEKVILIFNKIYITQSQVSISAPIPPLF